MMKELKSMGVKINSQRELMLPHGDTVSGSDIVSLLKEIFVGSRMSKESPIGWEHFTDLVASSAAPLDMISKGPARNIVKQLRNETFVWDDY